MRNREDLEKQVHYIHTTYECDALIQEYVAGDEYNVGILGRGQSIEVLAISRLNYDELPTGHEKILTYNSKWKEDSVEFNQITVNYNPKDISDELRERLIKSAVNSYQALGLKDYGRVDFRVQSGPSPVPLVIDVNPNPDLSPDAGLANMALYAREMNYTNLIKQIIQSALNHPRR